MTKLVILLATGWVARTEAPGIVAMPERVQVGQAKAHLSSLLDRVEGGEEILIARRNKVIARLVPEQESTRSAADVFRSVNALGGLHVECPDELPAEPVDLD